MNTEIDYSIIKTLTEEQKIAFAAVYSGANIFLTSGGGCGKSYLIDVIAQFLPNVVLLAPTGVSALNIKGATLHSFFSLPYGFHSSLENDIELSKEDIARLTAAETILIDEVSMTRCDTLDRIDKILKVANHTNLPFGGKQLILVGDFCQLPPVVVNNTEESVFLRKFYKGSYYAFNSAAWNAANFKYFVLSEVKRISDKEGVRHLRNLRMGLKIEEAINFINNSAGNQPLDTDIRLYPTNKMVDEYNLKRYKSLPGREFLYTGVKKGKFPESSIPVPEEIGLKVGCRVMFVINDKDQGVVNGDMGTVEKLTRRKVIVKLDRGHEIIEIGKYTWDAYEYDCHAERVHSGSYQQYPVKLAFAISQHKSQGQSIKRSVISFKPRTFAAGQAYVALSRITNLEGLSLEHPIKRSDIKFSKEAAKFTIAISKNALSNRKQGLNIQPETIYEQVIERDVQATKEKAIALLSKVSKECGGFNDWVRECISSELSVIKKHGSGDLNEITFDINGIEKKCGELLNQTESQILEAHFYGRMEKEFVEQKTLSTNLSNFNANGDFVDMSTIDSEYLF